MTRGRFAILLGLGLVTLGGCGVSRPWELVPQPVAGLPERFVPPGPPSEPPPAGCRSRLLDPRGGAELFLIRSTTLRDAPGQYRGDYEVIPTGRYGIGADTLLRLECGTGRPLGAVPRRA
ncbi:MAG TPA: hypothetical protein VFH97_06170 [Gemmatimonadales bacterium]|nr:hypothetical protein [Gemmatimonadales bacterium]